MFILYDSTKEFFNQLMTAKKAQKSGSEEQRSGYFKRLKYFATNSIESLFKIKNLNQSIPHAFIYVRGDECSHVRERKYSGSLRKKFYSA